MAEQWTGARRIDRGRNHHYEIDGARVDGVTTIIGSGMPKPALAYWAAKSVATYVADLDVTAFAELKAERGRAGLAHWLKTVPWRDRDAAAAKGTEVHKYADALIGGAEVVDVPAELESYVDSAVKFMNEWKPRPVLTETVVASRRWRYAGTFDLIADLPDGRRVLFDYKTSRSGIWPETALQLAAYRHADFYVGDDGTEIPLSEVGITECMAVWVRPDGYAVIPLNADEQVFKAFLHVQYVSRVASMMRDWVLPEVFPA